MLLVHQTGNVRIGEVVRYTLTYTPSHDRILPAPSDLYVKIRNTSAIPLRAAYLHGPYTLYAACYPTTFDPNYRDDGGEEDGSPQFEPNLKAGGSWMSRLTVPERIRNVEDKYGLLQDRDGPSSPPSCTWIIEISSQVIFSLTAAVHFELLISRDERSLELGFANLMGQAPATPGQLEDHQQIKRKGGHGAAQPKGVYSHAVKLLVEDTAALWNKPSLPTGDEGDDQKPGSSGLVNGDATAGKVDVGHSQDKAQRETEQRSRKKKKIHLVVLTHGLHSNLGADMLYLKESIDITARKAREEKRQRREEAQKPSQEIKASKSTKVDDAATSKSADPESKSHSEDSEEEEEEEEEEGEEEVIVRGFPGNACRTERGIQYLGKRLAKWILELTYPDQPFLPAKKSLRKKMSRVLTGEGPTDTKKGTPEHKGSSIYKPTTKAPILGYQITSISFVGHSLGGLTQTYAIAYIHKHSPHFFDEIKPINFVAMAAPFLGLSNENPLYVKFALDFGLVGRTGQDLGLTWKSSTALRGGWDSMIAGIGTEGQRAKQPDPGSKPLLRILPTGHTHQVMKKFRNRTIYSNVVNDGIVPLRTSCLLFLDWSGLGRVEKARREGLVSGLASWGWAEMTGANASSRHLRADFDSDAWSQSNASNDGTRSRSRSRNRNPSSKQVPQPDESAVDDEDNAESPKESQFFGEQHRANAPDPEPQKLGPPPQQQPAHPITSFLSLFKPSPPKGNDKLSTKQSKIYKRSQTTKLNNDGTSTPEGMSSAESSRRPSNIRGDSMLNDPNNAFAPPKTTILESAGDVLNPPLPTQQYLTDPRSRPRTIFHDRVYHPDEIPPPQAKKPPRPKRSASSNSKNGISKSNTSHGDGIQDMSNMKVEEKIARAYHHGLSWRKVLVRLEPDAHNNMVVRRMFANAYGWPVVKHLVDTHFADTYEAATADLNEPSVERAKPTNEPVGFDGEERQDLQSSPEVRRTDSEIREAKDSVPELKKKSGDSYAGSSPSRNDSTVSTWDDAIFEGSDDDEEVFSPVAAKGHGFTSSPQQQEGSEDDQHKGTSEREIAAFLGKPKPTIDTSPQQGSAHLVASPKSTTSLGLGKSIEEQLNTAQKTDLPGSENKEEQHVDLSELQIENGH